MCRCITVIVKAHGTSQGSDQLGAMWWCTHPQGKRCTRGRDSYIEGASYVKPSTGFCVSRAAMVVVMETTIQWSTSPQPPRVRALLVPSSRFEIATRPLFTITNTNTMSQFMRTRNKLLTTCKTRHTMLR